MHAFVAPASVALAAPLRAARQAAGAPTRAPAGAEAGVQPRRGHRRHPLRRARQPRHVRAVSSVASASFVAREAAAPARAAIRRTADVRLNPAPRMALNVFTSPRSASPSSSSSSPPPRFADVLAAQMPDGNDASRSAVDEKFVVYDSSRCAHSMVDVATARDASVATTDTATPAAAAASAEAAQVTSNIRRDPRADNHAPAKSAGASRATAHATLVIWPRHFGCALCRRNIADIAAHHEQLVTERQWRVVVVGNGTPEHARDFECDPTLRIPSSMRVFTDPLRCTYLALSFQRGVRSTFNLRGLAKVVRALTGGARQRWDLLPTDAFQQGGCALVSDERNGEDGRLLMLQRSEYAGDTLSADELLRLEV